MEFERVVRSRYRVENGRGLESTGEKVDRKMTTVQRAAVNPQRKKEVASATKPSFCVGSFFLCFVVAVGALGVECQRQVRRRERAQAIGRRGRPMGRRRKRNTNAQKRKT